MIKKQKEIIELINLINDAFGEDTFIIRDYWDRDSSAIGLQVKDKLIYIAAYGRNDYFYECEILADDPDVIYVAKSTENNVSIKRILEVIKDFFEIKRRK